MNQSYSQRRTQFGIRDHKTNWNPILCVKLEQMAYIYDSRGWYIQEWEKNWKEYFILL